MRKILLASAAILGTMSGAWAQGEGHGAPVGAQSQGMAAMPWMSGGAPNNNNNSMGVAGPGNYAVPTPGTVVIHLNGKVYTEMDLSFASSAQVAPGTLGAGTPGFKLNPVGIGSFLRLYPGVDGMAANGLRYGASAEIRQNFMGGNVFSASTTQNGTTGTNSGGSGNASAQTLYVRRAFTYIASDNFGIVRLGMGDGVVSLFDYTGIFTSGSWDGGIGNLLNSGVQAVTPNQYLLTWAFLSGNGQEYDPDKIVYLTPQFFGFDFGVEYDPSQGNVFSNVSTSSPYQIGTCVTASSNCIGVTSGNDPSRWINRVAAGVRYMGNFGGVAAKAYGVYIASGKESAPASAGRFDGLNEFNGGVAITYAGFTVNADATFGRTDGANGLVVQGGAPMSAVLFGASYSNGPWAVGGDVAFVDHQGSNNLVHISQRHEFAFSVGGVYKIAPGLNLALEYQYLQKHQGGFNFAANANGPAGNDTKVQGITLASIMNW